MWESTSLHIMPAEHLPIAVKDNVMSGTLKKSAAIFNVFGACILVLLVQASAWGQFDGGAETKWSLNRSSFDAASGETIHIEVTAKIPKGWHIYSLKKLEKGPIASALAIETTESDKWLAINGDIQHPAPIEKLDPGFNIKVEMFKGTVTFKVPVRIEKIATPGEHKVNISVRSQMCNDSTCLPPDSKKLPFTINVSESSGTGIEPTHQEAIRYDGKPEATASEAPVQVDLFLSATEVTPGALIPAAIRLNIKPEWHVNSNKPPQENLIATRVIASAGSNLTIEKLAYPAPVMLKPAAPGMDPLPVFENSSWIRLMLRAPESGDAGSKLTLNLELSFQACKVLCYPPATIKLSYDISIQKEAASPALHGELFKKLEWPSSEALKGDKEPTQNTQAQTFQTSTPPAEVGPRPQESIWLMLWFGFLGGLILNVMPCVLPVISLKIFGLVSQSGDGRKDILKHGLTYGAGVWTCFMAFAIAIIILKHGAESVGWGFQFQEPLFVAILAVVIFGFGLSMLGVFEIPALGLAKMEKASAKTGIAGSFTHGLFATLLATPCTAPFLGTALGFAFAQTDLVIVVMFSAIALGLALPFLLLGFFPGWTRFMPKPGAWMNTFKEVMGFLMVGTVIWLLSTLLKQINNASMIRFFIFLCLTGLGAWILGKWATPVSTTRSKWVAVGLTALLLGGNGVWLLDFKARALGGERKEVVNGVEWHPYSLEFIKTQSNSGRPVFVDATAEWCATCKVNENSVIFTDEIAGLMKDLGYVAVKADNTNKDPRIMAWLAEHKRAGVPLYVVIPPNNFQKKFVLPPILTHSIMVEGLKRGAGKL